MQNIKHLKKLPVKDIYNTCLPEYHGYQGTLTFKRRWPIENLVAVTGTTESVSPLQANKETSQL
jgi:hypothetical protein